MKSISVASALGILVAAITVPAMAAEPIVGTWKRPNGTILKYSPAGGSRYCGRVMTGEYKGKSIGCMSGTGGTYEGEVIKLDEGRTYTGKATATPASMTLKGCVLGGIICKGETLTRD